MRYIDDLKWPSVLSYVIVWVVMSAVTWGLLCLLLMVFMYPVLQAGLVPVPIMLVLALIPVSSVTLMVQTALFLIGLVKWPDSPENNKRLVLICTLPLSWFCLWLVTYLAGGADSFVIRI